MSKTSCVQPLSCDEAFLDVTGLGDPEAVARELRAHILSQTGCTASAGIGPNMLLARLATKKAKPNGQSLINAVQVGAHAANAAGAGSSSSVLVPVHPNQMLGMQADEELLKLEVGELPGVGWSLCEKLKGLGVNSVAEVRQTRRDILQRELGTKTGHLVSPRARATCLCNCVISAVPGRMMPDSCSCLCTKVWEYAHGRDERVVEPPQARKSVGAEINYGVRFDGEADAESFVDQLAGT
jgi:DNA repair protein REV1